MVKRGLKAEWLAIATFAVACGGRSTTDLTHGDGGSAARGGAMSTGATGGATLGAGGGQVEGGTGGVSSGATSGSGAAKASCYYAGTYYAEGDSYPAGDGCNYCTCTTKGSACGSSSCGGMSATGGSGGASASCDAIRSKWFALYTQAERCTPGPGACDALVSDPVCRCKSYVSSSVELDALLSDWDQRLCSEFPVACPACQPLGMYHYCDDTGTCVSSDTPPAGGTAGVSGVGGAGGVAGASGFTAGGLGGAGALAGAAGSTTGGLGGAGGPATGGLGGTAGGLGGDAGASSAGLSGGGFGGAAGTTSAGGYAGMTALDLSRCRGRRRSLNNPGRLPGADP